MINRSLIFATILAAVVALAVGILVGHFAIGKTSTVSKYDRLTREADQQNYRTFINSVQAKNIEDNLRDLTSRPHMAGLPEDLDSAVVIEQRWKNDGLQVYKPKYNVLLSYPDDKNPNRVTLAMSNGNMIFQTTGTEHVYDSTQPKTVDPFLAYTPNGNRSSPRLYYGNYGQLEDLQALASKVGNVSLSGSIIIMRYGKIFRGDKVKHAQQFGAVGAILYNDPADYAPFGTSPDQVYDQKWYMPTSGVQRGSAYTGDGDPLTPIYPSTEYMYRVEENTVKFLPNIPAQPIGYAEARVFLQHMQGEEVEQTWRGRLENVTYRYGGDLISGSQVTVTSYNRRERRDTYNVVGIMKGDIEPDRYVVIGNHRDAWSLGAIDPTSGTAVLLEITRVLGEMYRKGFRPRRSLMFCSWGAEEYGLIGSVEYVQEYVKVLGARIVSYLNVDVAVEGNFTVDASASPMLFDVVVDAAKMTPSAYDPSETIFDKWKRVHWNNNTNEPNIGYGLGSGSDYLAFNQLAGSSNFDTSYTFDRSVHGGLGSYPLYHTSYEVFSMVKNFVDPTFEAHRTIAQFAGVLALLLSETPVLPLNVQRYASALILSINSLQLADRTLLDPLVNAVTEFNQTAKEFIDRSKSMDTNNPYEIRAYNDQLLQVERAFLNPLGQGGDYLDWKHIIFAPAKTNQYAASGFPAIGDAIYLGDTTEIKNQIAIATYFIKSASTVLKEFNKFIFA